MEKEMKLNPEQQAAADFQDGICCVIAIPGSGKTLTLSRRIETLVKKYSVDPSEILAVSFTKSASEAIRQKLAPSLNELSSRVHLATIHSFCHFLLRNEGRVFEILSGRDQIIFMRDIMRRLKAKELSIMMVLREISLGKNNMVSVDEFRILYEGDKSMQKIANIYEAYDREKAKRLLLDFDDLLVETHRLLTESEAVKEKYRGIFRHLLVDEWQDTNILQAEILKILVDGNESGTSFYVVGDDYQSIFNFTGASISNILNFSDMFPNAQLMFLSRNYRSTPQILKACHNLIRHNTKKIDKELLTNNPDGEDVIVLESSNEETEALALVNEIRELVDRRGFAYTDIACLYRCHFQSRHLEEAFSRHKIPYHIENGLNFYDRREVKVLLDYLRLIANPNSDEGDEALRSVINVPNRYLGRKFMAELDSFRGGDGIHLYEKLKSMPVELTYLRKNIREFIQLIDPLIEDAENLHPAELIQMLRSALDYDRVVVDSDLPAPDDPKIENLNQLAMAAARFSNIGSFLDYTDSFQNEAISDNRDGVRLSSIHRSKGLEWPVVFVVGLIEGLLPSKKGMMDLDSERRVAFVAISRAMKLLFLSHSLTYMGQPAKKSIFLDEILGVKEPETLS